MTYYIRRYRTPPSCVLCRNVEAACLCSECLNICMQNKNVHCECTFRKPAKIRNFKCPRCVTAFRDRLRYVRGNNRECREQIRKIRTKLEAGRKEAVTLDKLLKYAGPRVL